MPSANVPRFRSALARYSIPIVALGLATIVAVVLRHFAGSKPNVINSVTFLLAIMASAWWGGYVPGILSCLLAVFVVPYALVPHFHPSPEPTRIILVLLISVLISRVAQGRNRTEALLRQANENLDERVRQRTTELQRSNAELQRLNEDLNQFAYSASHDLQEPLRMIAIYSQMLERRYKEQLAPQAGEYIGHIVQGARRMEMLLKDLLAYAQSVNIPLEDVLPLDSNAVVAKALSNLSAAVSESGASVCYSALPQLCVQEVHLMQVFQNLIGNAIKYRREETPRVEISATAEGDSWNIRVADNGIGIPAAYRDQIFGMFKRLHSSDRYEGSGMGLAICQRVVERYGGRIWVESEEGRGSTFCFTLPGVNRQEVRLSA